MTKICEINLKSQDSIARSVAKVKKKNVDMKLVIVRGLNQTESSKHCLKHRQCLEALLLHCFVVRD